MSTIVTRTSKGSTLTWAEGDANFNNLNTDKAELTDLASNANGKGASLIGIEDPNDNFTATTVEGALEEHVEKATDAHDASAVSNVPAGSITATTVQAAIDELDADVNTRTKYFTSKPEAVTYITANGVTNGLSYIITSNDGGVFVGKTGASPGTYADDGGSYCGTQFIPTGGDGSSGLARNYGESIYAVWFGVTADGVTNDRPALQVAFDAIPVTGARLVLPAGSMVLDRTSIECTGKGNVQVVGAGMGLTILDGSAGNTTNPSGGGSGYGALNFNNVIGVPATLSNIYVADFSVKGSGDSKTDKLISFSGVNNFVAERVEFYDGYNEVLYCSGSSTADGITVKGCYFHDCLGQWAYALNTNSLGWTNILVEGNKFEDMTSGGLILGENIRYVNNSFKNISQWGVKVAESNTSTTRSISSCVISGNTFVGMGKPSAVFAHSTCVGIYVDAASKVYTDNSQESGIVVIGNTFKESYADVSIRLIQVNSGLVADNYASGLASEVSATSVFINAYFSGDLSGVNAVPTTITLRNNVLEKKVAGLNINFGLLVRSVDNSTLHCSGNVMDGDSAGATIESPGNGFLPDITLSGDVFAPDCRLYDLIGSDANGLTGIGAPLYGSNLTTFYNGTSNDVLSNIAARDLTGLTTPSVKGRNFYTQNVGPVTITNLTLLNAQTAPEVTIMFLDALTTVQNGANFKLAGGVNFVATYGSTLTLVKYGPAIPWWTEKSRSQA